MKPGHNLDPAHGTSSLLVMVTVLLLRRDSKAKGTHGRKRLIGDLLTM